MAMAERRENGHATLTPPPLRLEITYAITAWTKAIEDEHRLLSQILAILHSYKQLPADVLEGRGAALGPIDTTLGRPMEEKADFWSAVGGQYKPSVDFAVTLAAGVRRRVQARPRGAHAGRAHADLRRPAAHDDRVDPLRRPRARRRRRAGRRRLGRAAGRRARGRRPTATGASSSTASRSASTACSCAPPTARRPSRRSRIPGKHADVVLGGRQARARRLAELEVTRTGNEDLPETLPAAPYPGRARIGEARSVWKTNRPGCSSGNLEPILRLGLVAVLTEAGMDVVGHGGQTRSGSSARPRGCSRTPSCWTATTTTSANPVRAGPGCLARHDPDRALDARRDR